MTANCHYRLGESCWYVEPLDPRRRIVVRVIKLGEALDASMVGGDTSRYSGVAVQIETISGAQYWVPQYTLRKLLAAAAPSFSGWLVQQCSTGGQRNENN